jgi:hypothetical protein
MAHPTVKSLVEENTVCFFEVRFLAALASWLCWLQRFGLFLADELGKKFGQQFFSGPRYIVNFQLPAVTNFKKTYYTADSLGFIEICGKSKFLFTFV